jgi:antitoxin (DNA-binding transcriptional repressor) of toxin-antitoxin stability system
MSFHSFKVAAGAALTLIACLAAIPSTARPSSQAASVILLSQVNKPSNEGTPVLNTTEVQGRITKVEGDNVELRLTNGETRTYSITKADQERNRLQVGSDVTLTVRGDTVVAISPSTTTGATAGSAASSGSSSSSSSSSTTVIRRQTTVQQTRPAPAPSPAPEPSPSPQPVRGLW